MGVEGNLIQDIIIISVTHNIKLRKQGGPPSGAPLETLAWMIIEGFHNRI
jgi:hypothetical protein